MNDVVVTGLGFITSVGNSREEVADSLRSGLCGIAPWRFGMGQNSETPVKVAGAVKGFELSSHDHAAWTWPSQWNLDRPLVRGVPPHGIYAVCALEQALSQAGLSRSELSDGATGLFCASAGSPKTMRYHLQRMEDCGWRRGHPLGITMSTAGTLNFNLAAHYAIRGASCGFVSACTSSAHALGYAMDEIRLGRQETMLVIGAEELTPETLLPFHAMGALSLDSNPETACCPFDIAAQGFVGAEGATALVLESELHAKRRGARPIARILGWGQASDGFAIATPHPTGDGIQRAVLRALGEARVQADRIDYLNAHATSTPAGDRSEALALQALFPAAGPAISSTKALTGHGLSLAAVMEAAFCILALDQHFVPGQFHLSQPLPEASGLDLPRASRDTTPRHVLNVNSGFGGSNVCHVFSRYE